MKNFVLKLLSYLITIIVVSVILSAVLGMALIFVSNYANHHLTAQIDGLLIPVSEKLKWKISHDNIRYNYLTGPQISKIHIIPQDKSSALNQITIEKITFDYSIQFKPSFSINLEGIKLDHPEVKITRKNKEETEASFLISQTKLWDYLSQIEQTVSFLNRSVSDTVKVNSLFVIHWEDGALQTTRHYLDKSEGQIKVNLTQKNYSVDADTHFRPHWGHWTVNAKGNKDNLEVTVKTNNTKLKPFESFFPKIVQTTEDSEVEGTFTVKLSAKTQNKAVLFDANFKDLTLNHWRLAEKPIQHIDFKTQGRMDWDNINKLIKIGKMHLGSKKVSASLNGFVDYGKKPKIEAHFFLPPSPIQDVLEAIPEDFIPVVKDAEVSGTVALDFDLQLDVANPRQLKMEPAVAIEGYSLIRPPLRANIFKLKKSFEHTAYKKGKAIKTFTVGPGKHRFVSHVNLGKNTIRGVLTSEDGSFYRHNGFQFKHIRESLIQNVRDKRFTRGGSTITMQTAKNLFLSGQKNISRKFQEMLLAYALEQELPKKRILEIYMNIIEWGPNLYGIGNASRHYFYKSPSKLTPLEAAFLGSIISNPTRHHYMYKRGSITDQWATYLEIIVSKMGVEIDENDPVDPSELEFGWVRKKREKEEKEAEENSLKKNKKKKKRG